MNQEDGGNKFDDEEIKKGISAGVNVAGSFYEFFEL